MVQRTLILIKPDAMERNLAEEIIKRYKKVGLKVVKQKKMV
ncbi:nucleoside-diphosphate kinase, partial [Candidatus Daviesbacteria bacterium]|nr:nucleoside-diphosphate kinase [Candidatus Daviesbacteria bacterium]